MKEIKCVMKISILSGVVLLMLISVLSISFFLRFSETQNLERDKSTYEYKYLRLNSLTNETSLGILSTPTRLKEDYEFISNEEEQIYELVSEFGKNEYYCTGSCVCEDARRVSSVITTSLSFLVASVTTILAYNKAKNYFEQECIRQYSGQCSNSARITSNIDQCESLFPEFDKEIEKVEKKKYFEENYQKYWCRGWCVTNKFKKERTRILAEEFRCLHLVTDGDVWVKRRRAPKEESFYIEEAKVQFAKEFLKEYCKDNSRTTFFKEPKNDPTPASPPEKKKKKKYGTWNTVVLCLGTKVDEPTSNISCIIIPKGMKTVGNQLVLFR